jgi:hypothetical protein
MYFVPSSLKAPPPPSLPGQSSMSKPGEPPLATYRVQLPRRLRGLAESILKLVFSEHRSSGPSRTCASARAEYAGAGPRRHFLPKPLFLRAASLLLGPFSILLRAAIRLPKSSVYQPRKSSPLLSPERENGAGAAPASSEASRRYRDLRNRDRDTTIRSVRLPWRSPAQASRPHPLESGAHRS